jgi:hypothetical protein
LAIADLRLLNKNHPHEVPTWKKGDGMGELTIAGFGLNSFEHFQDTWDRGFCKTSLREEDAFDECVSFQ